MRNNPGVARELSLGDMKVLVFEDDESLAERAALDVGAKMLETLRRKGEVNLILSGAESQEKFLQALSRNPLIEWDKVNYFAVDEFHAPRIDARYAVAAQPLRIFSGLPLKSRNTIDYAAADIEAERARYEGLIRRNPPDIACLGIGVSGHIAFNEPGQTDFAGSEDVRIISVDDASVAQLAQDPNFARLGDIPRKAITVTIPFLMRCPVVSVVVPYRIKAPIVRRLFECAEPRADLPASILLRKRGAVMYLDSESYSLCGDAKPARAT